MTPRFAIAENPENGVYPWEIVDLQESLTFDEDHLRWHPRGVVVRTSSYASAAKLAAELNEKGFIEIEDEAGNEDENSS